MHISKSGSGLLLYHKQEGRNIGLINKIKAYSLQDKGFDTIEANQKLGFACDERDFSVCINMLKTLKIDKINLLTNNPKKVNIFLGSGIYVQQQIPLIAKKNYHNNFYLNTKNEKMDHIFLD